VTFLKGSVLYPASHARQDGGTGRLGQIESESVDLRDGFVVRAPAGAFNQRGNET
jgi:hypothetical protein